MSGLIDRRPAGTVLATIMVAVVVASCGGGGNADEPTEPTIPADATSIVGASAAAMGDTTSVHFELRRTGAPVFIDEFERLALNSVVGDFAVPGSAKALLEVAVGDGVVSELGAIALRDEI